MDSSSVYRRFLKALCASLVTPLVLTGCDNDLDLTGYAPPSCEGGGLAVSGLTPATPVDGVQLRVTTAIGGEVEQDRVVTSSGTVCATASNPPVCQSAVENLGPQSSFHKVCHDICSAYYVATTRGDDVTAHASLEALRTFLGTVDTTQEAALIAFAEGYDLACDNLQRGAIRMNADGGFSIVATRGFACGKGTELTRFELEVSSSGALKEVSSKVLERGNDNCAIGRRPVGLRRAEEVACADALGRHFAAAAHLEAASINAFLRLREELALHGADATLQDAALRSACEEVQHTEVSTRLAGRFGASPPRPGVEALPLRSLFEVALDNAVEGCVRETFGALVAHHQAANARDEGIRQAMARIAEDETRHAGLSWAIDRWAQAQLSDSERALLREARDKAVAALREEMAHPPEAVLIEEAGLPAPEVASAMMDSLTQDLWACR
ncbi:ferritin-like domain-containing protein [Stigmatella sp. ncwal1]|uniref:Ferritin-like domain-containing protein n=1 Tax=Stigmatella ashevillensis TaxID=2995309 RepID=A0ABT5DL72_9BACT|nr:ferritin-like domain-containing protein [Stigmatella ashevillena]MDC0713885.1 ferritin-like domain-containing protein [Stigmatella ashevillena]